jgi:hypothetical protein
MRSSRGGLVQTVDHRRRLSLLRPFEDFTRLQVADALEDLGGHIVRAFVDPVPLAEVHGYLRRDGWTDRLVIPFDPRDGDTGLELLVALHRIAGSHRRYLMPARGAEVATAERAVRAQLPAEVCTRLLVVPLEELLSGTARTRIVTHLTLPRATRPESAGPVRAAGS